jgi:hypothetical protein
LEAEGRADISDATMTYFLLTGDEDADLNKLKSLLDDKRIPAPIDARRQIRIEAENFKTLDNFLVESSNDRNVSHRLEVKRERAPRQIRTPFDQPYTTDTALYDVEVQYLDQKNSPSRFTLLINGKLQGSSWSASGDGAQWTTHTISEVTVRTGDEITVEVQPDGDQASKLDYVQLNYKARTAGL